MDFLYDIRIIENYDEEHFIIIGKSIFKLEKEFKNLEGKWISTTKQLPNWQTQMLGGAYLFHNDAKINVLSFLKTYTKTFLTKAISSYENKINQEFFNML